MKDMRVRELLGLAAQGIEVPDDPAVDDIMHKADRVRRRRRIMLAAGSAAAVVAVGVGTALLPQPGLGAPRGDIAGSAPATPPGDTSAPPTSTTADATGSASSVPGNRPRSSEPPPSSSSATTSAPRTTPPTASTKAPSSGGSTTRTTGGTPPSAKSALDFVKSKLPAGVGVVTKETLDVTPSYTVNPLSGRYLVSKNGRTGWLDIEVFDPKVNPDQPRETVEQIRDHNFCADYGVVAPNTNCAQNPESEGGIFKTWRSPGNQQEPAAGHVSGPAYHALVYYPDGRGLKITAAAGVTGSDQYAPAMDAPPITAEQLTDLVGGSGWFRS